MSDTRQRVLESACEVFAEKGFKNSTVVDICSKAGANVASINYYFSGKESLYREALRLAFRNANARFPLDGGLPEDAPPEERLKAFIAARLGRIFCNDPNGYAQKMVAHDRRNPVSSVVPLFTEMLAPEHQILGGLIRDLARTEISEESAGLCAFNIISLCDFLSFDQRARNRFLKKRAFSAEDIGRMAEHITRFALGGIQYALDIADRT